MPVLVDTSAVYALADSDTVAHDPVRAYVQSNSDILVLPVTVLPEADYMIATRLGQHVAAAFLRTVVSGAFVLVARQASYDG
jgi:predicted nucleic acid-binding protein